MNAKPGQVLALKVGKDSASTESRTAGLADRKIPSVHRILSKSDRRLSGSALLLLVHHLLVGLAHGAGQVHVDRQHLTVRPHNVHLL